MDDPSVEGKSWNCLVCSAALQAHEGCFRRIYNEPLILICCPLCFESFERDPASYLHGNSVATDPKSARAVIRSGSIKPGRPNPPGYCPSGYEFTLVRLTAAISGLHVNLSLIAGKPNRLGVTAVVRRSRRIGDAGWFCRICRSYAA
jgi:hypothetical protein